MTVAIGKTVRDQRRRRFPKLSASSGLLRAVQAFATIRAHHMKAIIIILLIALAVRLPKVPSWFNEVQVDKKATLVKPDGPLPYYATPARLRHRVWHAADPTFHWPLQDGWSRIAPG